MTTGTPGPSFGSVGTPGSNGKRIGWAIAIAAILAVILLMGGCPGLRGKGGKKPAKVTEQGAVAPVPGTTVPAPADKKEEAEEEADGSEFVTKAELNAKLAEVAAATDEDLGTVKTDLTTLTGRVDAIDGANGALAKLRADLAANGQADTALERRVTDVTRRVNRHDERLSALEALGAKYRGVVPAPAPTPTVEEDPQVDEIEADDVPALNALLRIRVSVEADGAQLECEDGVEVDPNGGCQY